MLIHRPGTERGFADHGWLRSFHSFSFADYFDRQHMHFGPLRVINEDWIAPQTGFGTHPHQNMEIITYLLSGELTHQDSMGHRETIRSNEVQRMSAGTGITHSEFNAHPTETCHLLQIWIMPTAAGITPSYEQTEFTAADKRGKLCLVAAPAPQKGVLALHADAYLWAGQFHADECATYALSPQRMAYVHLATGNLSVNGITLKAGDALMIRHVPDLSFTAGQQAEVLLFDLPLDVPNPTENPHD